MSTLTLISLVVNFGFIMLVLTLVYPRVIKLYRTKKKSREIQRKTKEKQYIRKVVNDYLEELRND
jgi:Flp pilus assembly protein TadB